MKSSIASKVSCCGPGALGGEPSNVVIGGSGQRRECQPRLFDRLAETASCQYGDLVAVGREAARGLQQRADFSGNGRCRNDYLHHEEAFNGLLRE